MFEHAFLLKFWHKAVQARAMTGTFLLEQSKDVTTTGNGEREM